MRTNLRFASFNSDCLFSAPTLNSPFPHKEKTSNDLTQTKLWKRDLFRNDTGGRLQGSNPFVM